ncbi:hypothetical protein Tco_1320957 [Tanacetum coccineum]
MSSIHLIYDVELDHLWTLRIASVMKVIKEESEILGMIMIDDDLFTCYTPLGMIFNEFNLLSGMDDDLFTYEVKILELSYSTSVEQQMDDLDNGNVDVFKRKECYDECEKIYVKVIIFIDKRLVSYKKKFEEYMEIKKQKEEYRLDAGMEYDPLNVDFGKWLAMKFSNYMMMDWIKTDIFQFKTPLCEAFKEFNYLLKIDVDVLTNDILGLKTYNDYKNAWIYEWNNDVPWVTNMPWLDYRPWMEPSDDIEHVCKPFRFKNGHAKWPTCNWKMEKYCNDGDLQDELKYEALNYKAILEESMNMQEESSENAKTYYSPSDKWEYFEHASHLGADASSNYNPYLDVSRIFNDHGGINNDYEN